jgi:8-oxo-dGTP pyrophosphatase MutT (NUDIX family)
MTAAIDWRARILQRLGGTVPRPGPQYERYAQSFAAAPVPAAVLIPVVEREPEATVLLTVRATAMRQHAGQIAFPGGRIEAQDAGPAAAALREAREEIGLATQYSQVIGYLPDHLVFTGFRVTPVVALVRPGFNLKFDTREVAEAFEIPLSHVFDPLNHKSRRRRFRDMEVEMHEIPFGERNIWGATAAMLLNLYEILNQAESAV